MPTGFLPAALFYLVKYFRACRRFEQSTGQYREQNKAGYSVACFAMRGAAGQKIVESGRIMGQIRLYQARFRAAPLLCHITDRSVLFLNPAAPQQKHES